MKKKLEENGNKIDTIFMDF